MGAVSRDYQLKYCEGDDCKSVDKTARARVKKVGDLCPNCYAKEVLGDLFKSQKITNLKWSV